MKTVFVWFFVMFLCFPTEAQDILIDRASRISFFSEAPLEDISAVTQKATSALDTNTREIAFKVPIKSFEFRKQLMQEHFNENYMESAKFPYATFGGRIKEPLDWSQDGTYRVTVSGNLEIHGVKKFYTTDATIEVKGGLIAAHAKFNVKVADHGIKIPRIVVKNIAEIVDVEITSTYQKQ
ncbi:YceI family protein [Parapedobacter pyrenivorans]|uniref:YceI family protein n=1 Tax=Parapedobacter pyrenivorans TaxID=1305674 RepID=UPI003340AFF5